MASPANSPVRVRFAPSPTGMFHVGSARTILYNWVLAKQSNGTLFLRIEDTDASRNAPEWVDGIINALTWLGIHPSDYDGPHFQSEYADEHAKATTRLAESGRAYYCDCTREEVVARTGNIHRGYDGHCRDRGLTSGPGRALRFRTPDEGQTLVKDLIRGEVEFSNEILEDFVIARADGSAMFLLANVVDDMTMGITHVVRGEEHLPNTPKQQLLYEALDASPPAWAHVSVLVNEARKKLSKRRDKVALEDYRKEGYLSSAMCNYLMLLGWSPTDNREIVPWSVIAQEFRLEDVTGSPAFFDVKKLRAFNGEYIRELPLQEFIAACQPWLSSPVAPWDESQYDPDVFALLAPHAQTRVAVLSEITAMVDFVFLDQPVFDEAFWAKGVKHPASYQILAEAIAAFETVTWEAGALKATVEEIGAAHDVALGKAQAPIRIATTGRNVGLPLFESLAVLGRERTLDRLRAAHARLG